jgi:hypothetical protein
MGGCRERESNIGKGIKRRQTPAAAVIASLVPFQTNFSFDTNVVCFSQTNVDLSAKLNSQSPEPPPARSRAQPHHPPPLPPQLRAKLRQFPGICNTIWCQTNVKIRKIDRSRAQQSKAKAQSPPTPLSSRLAPW